MYEKRKFVRVPERSPIMYKVLSHPRMEGFITRDISEGGVRFLTHEFIAVDSLLDIRLELPSENFSVEATVRVMWVKKHDHIDGYEVGVEFVNLPEEVIADLTLYIKSLLGIK